jgi:tRNA threonylcarbamoyladenosine biosynthesis protein TsaB
MNLLALDTSTEALSIAVQHGGGVWLHTGAGGAQASATLIPAIRDCMARAGLAFAALDAIVFGRGPGSFTGLRTACSVAQGLAFGAQSPARPAGVPVLPVDTLLAVAEEARHQHGLAQVVAVLDARMDEVYTAPFQFDGQRWSAPDDFGLLAPERIEVPAGWALAGNADTAYPGRIAPAVPVAARVQALPTASALLRLAPALLAAGQALPPDQALPRYIRDKVAKTTQERADERQAQGAAGLA